MKRYSKRSLNPTGEIQKSTDEEAWRLVVATE